MASAIGMRVYEIGVHRKKSAARTSLRSPDLNVNVPSFISDFVKKNVAITQNDALERSWYFQEKKAGDAGSSKGYVQYGTYGFESLLVDTKTKAQNYHRKSTDIEQIPLFYQFWCPPKSEVGLVAFQSFQGRSCITLVMTKMQDLFEVYNPDFVLTFKKILPNDVKGGVFGKLPVKRLRLISHKSSTDVFDTYLDDKAEAVDVELIVSARRRRGISSLSALLKKLPASTDGVLTHAGIDFDEAVAEIRVGNRTRRVGVLGVNGDAGVIDITDAIERGGDGHPTFDSLEGQFNEILSEFFKILSSVIK